MSYRTIASRVRRRGVVLALPIVVASLGLAFAQTAAADTVYTPMNSTDLTNDIAAANAAGGFNKIILSNSATYSPTVAGPITITGHLEITGNPTDQAGTSGVDTNISGANISNFTTSDFLSLASGANVIFKGFDLSGCGDSSQTACVRMLQGSTAEFDNFGLNQEAGDGIDINGGANAVFNNSTLENGSFVGIHLAPPISGTTTSATLNNTTDVLNGTEGILWSPGDVVNLNNSVVGQNNQNAAGGSDCSEGGGVTVSLNESIASMDSDGSCHTTSTSSAAAMNLQGANVGNGPTIFNAPAAPSSLIGAGNAMTCQSDDQTFWLRSGSNCDIGAVQSQTVQDTSTTGPSCPVTNTNESSNPATQTVTVTAASGTGLGPDAITNASGTTAGGTFTGTIAWPTVSGTSFDETAPSAGTGLTDEPSTAGFPVTASKALGDTTVGDTKWSFTATDWLGNSTNCH